VQSNTEICGGNSDDKVPLLSVLKKVHYLQDTFFVVIDRKLVNELRISQDDDIWVQQTLSDGGIFMKLTRKIRTKTN
jgi:hypothetical protein